MPWSWSGHDKRKPRHDVPAANTQVTPFTWRDTLLEPRTLIPPVALTVSTVLGLRLYKNYFRRIPTVNHIKPDYFRRRTLFGQVTSVGDADNFRLYHTPGGRIAGWGWLPWKTVPTKREALLKQTLHIRIAGVDAPELAHWGREAQPYSKEAFEWLTNLILHQRVRVQLYRRDQYDRVVAQVYYRRWFFKKDVGLEMLKMGLATVYEAKTGAEFGNVEQQYRAAEEKARESQVGMWTKPSMMQRLVKAQTKVVESPREYKSRHSAAEEQKKGG